MDPIEVEVVEIDGRKPSDAVPGSQAESPGQTLPARHFPHPGDGPPGDPDDSAAGGVPWRQWSGTVRTIHPALWPVVFLLGAILLAVLLTAGLVIGILFLILRTLARTLRAFFR